MDGPANYSIFDNMHTHISRIFNCSSSIDTLLAQHHLIQPEAGPRPVYALYVMSMKCMGDLREAPASVFGEA